MLKNRILLTLRFFDLQDYPPTLLELHNFLIADVEKLKSQTDAQGEITISNSIIINPKVPIDQILNCLDSECRAEVQNTLGFYHLAGRKDIVGARLDNYFYGIKREKLIKKYALGLKYIPFSRGAALAGSQAMGQQKQASDIDLLIITDPKFMWLARTLVTAYFQILGKRRHGPKITNRFCLNHYLAGPKEISELKNLYTAAEYLKLRPLVYGHSVWAFQKINLAWIKTFFPNAEITEPEIPKPSKIQMALENMLSKKFGIWLEAKLKNWQLPKIRREKFIVVKEDELSFHPDSKQQSLLTDFFKFQE